MTGARACSTPLPDPDAERAFSIAERAEAMQADVQRSTAERWRLAAEAVAHAVRAPRVYLGLGDAAAVPAGTEGRDLARRAAVADLAVRLHVSEASVSAEADAALALQTRLPQLWRAFTDGGVNPRNAHAAARVAMSIPRQAGMSDDDLAVWLAPLDAELTAAARALAPARFERRARDVRERLHPEGLTERHRRALAERQVWVEPDLDGMAWLHAKLPADAARSAERRLDACARRLAGEPDETRTLPQLRADVLGDLLTRGRVAGMPEVRASILVTVPVLTLLGAGGHGAGGSGAEEPGILDGYGPIPAEMVRRIAADAPSFRRLLIHPIDHTPLALDRTVYRVPGRPQTVGERDRRTVRLPRLRATGRRVRLRPRPPLGGWRGDRRRQPAHAVPAPPSRAGAMGIARAIPRRQRRSSEARPGYRGHPPAVLTTAGRAGAPTLLRRVAGASRADAMPR